MNAASSSPVLGIHHVGIVAHDAVALARFHERAAGLIAWHGLQTLALGDNSLALAGPNAGLRLMPHGPAPVRRPVSEAGITHVCLQSPVIESLHAAFATADANFHSPLVDLGTGFLYCYARDPEHNVIELEGVAPVWAEARPWLAHVNVACADIGKQCDFYAALLGRPAARSPRLRGDARLDRIADLSGVELRMAWIDGGNMQIELIHYSQPAAVSTGEHSTRREAGAGGHAYIALEVSDLDAARQHLMHCAGTLRDEPLPPGVARGADPEGNALWLLDRGHLTAHGASISQLPQPDITARFAAARARLQGTA
jgi:catechol 2,3-dioxygenase-like lactoylglutathione lyase family enzyme